MGSICNFMRRIQPFLLSLFVLNISVVNISVANIKAHSLTVLAAIVFSLALA